METTQLGRFAAPDGAKWARLGWHDTCSTSRMADGAFSDRAPRILVAEDDDEMRRVLVDALRGDGCEVYEVSDGGALLIELARNHRFHYDTVDLVVSDVRMPLCSGLQALETLRGTNARTRFLLLTAFGDEGMHARAAALGAMLLDKPFSTRKLRHTVADLLASAPQTR